MAGWKRSVGAESKRTRVCTPMGWGHEWQGKAQERAHVGPESRLQAGAVPHKRGLARSGAMDGGSTASFRCRRIYLMTLAPR